MQVDVFKDDVAVYGVVVVPVANLEIGPLCVKKKDPPFRICPLDLEHDLVVVLGFVGVDVRRI